MTDAELRAIIDAYEEMRLRNGMNDDGKSNMEDR